MFIWNSLAFSMIQWMLAVWSLGPLSFLKPAWTSGSSRFAYCWSLAWRILSITLRGVRWVQLCDSLSWSSKRQRNQTSNCQHPLDHRKRKSSRETSISALLTMPKPLTVDHNKLWKILKEIQKGLGYQTTWPASWETYMQVTKQQLELDMEQQTGSK